ncbi:MAG: hypothetical protein ACYTFG_20080, partial [Planctomycetota bacterium]
MTIEATINVSRLWRDFEKARRIAALRKFGDKVGVILQEEMEGKKGEKTPHWGFLGALGVERSLMMYKFRPLPMGPLREKYRVSLEGGSKLTDPVFKIEMVESLAALGAHVRIVGGITLAALPDEKGKDGLPLKVFAASWWGEVHVGDKYHRK